MLGSWRRVGLPIAPVAATAAVDERLNVLGKEPGDLVVVAGNYRGIFAAVEARYRFDRTRVLRFAAPPDDLYEVVRSQVGRAKVERVVQAGAAGAASVNPVIGAVAGAVAAVVGWPVTQRHAPDQAGRMLVGGALDRLVARGRVVVLVDLDITDPASLIVWEAIRYGLKTHRSPNLAVFVGVNAPEDLPDRGAETLDVLASISDTVRARTARWLWASPLGVPGVRRWLGGVPRDVAAELVAVAGGDDMIARDVWRRWRRSRTVGYRRRGSVRLATDPALSLVAGVVAACCPRDPSQAHRVVEFAARFGPRFHGPTVAATAAADAAGPRTADGAQAIIDTLCESTPGRPWLFEPAAGKDDPGWYRFVSTVLQDAVAGTVDAAAARDDAARLLAQAVPVYGHPDHIGVLWDLATVARTGDVGWVLRGAAAARATVNRLTRLRARARLLCQAAATTRPTPPGLVTALLGAAAEARLVGLFSEGAACADAVLGGVDIGGGAVSGCDNADAAERAEAACQRAQCSRTEDDLLDWCNLALDYTDAVPDPSGRLSHLRWGVLSIRSGARRGTQGAVNDATAALADARQGAAHERDRGVLGHNLALALVEIGAYTDAVATTDQILADLAADADPASLDGNEPPTAKRIEAFSIACAVCTVTSLAHIGLGDGDGARAAAARAVAFGRRAVDANPIPTHRERFIIALNQFAAVHQHVDPVVADRHAGDAVHHGRLLVAEESSNHYEGLLDRALELEFALRAAPRT